MLDKITGMFTGVLTGYLLGMVTGFTVFDPNLDVWALLGFVGALIGIPAGLTLRVRRHRALILAAVIGFYVGQLLNLGLINDPGENGLDLLQNGLAGFALVAGGTLLGGWLGWRYRSAALGYILFAAVWGGFVGGLIFGVVLTLAPAQTMWGWMPSVAVSGAICAWLAWRAGARSQADT